MNPIERIHDDAEIRRPDLIQLEQIASGYPSRERFLSELTLDPPEATSPLLDEDYLILFTIHSAKGQEWKSVFVLNVVDGCIPSDLGTGTTEIALGRRANTTWTEPRWRRGIGKAGGRDSSRP
jgi:DNA helicase-2/ATP-dependent DNA helicase PcrA